MRASALFGHLHGWQECSDQWRREQLTTNVQTAQEAVSCADASCMWCGSGMCTLAIVLGCFSLTTSTFGTFFARCNRSGELTVLFPPVFSTWYISMTYSQRFFPQYKDMHLWRKTNLQWKKKDVQLRRRAERFFLMLLLLRKKVLVDSRIDSLMEQQT